MNIALRQRAPVTTCVPSCWALLLGMSTTTLATILVVPLGIGFRFDDPYITMVYARNLLDGQGLVFNPGERVQGFTSPLHVLLLAGVGAVTGTDALPEVAACLSLIALWLSGCLLAWLCACEGLPSVATWVGGLHVLNYNHLESIGLETSLLLSLAIGAVAMWRVQRLAWCGLLMALATLTRADAVLLAVFLALMHVIFTRSIVLGPLVIYLSLVGTWNAFAWWYYGSPLPATLAAKQLQGALPDWQQPLWAIAGIAAGSYPVVALLWAVPVGLIVVWRQGLTALGTLIGWGLAQWIAYFVILHVVPTCRWYHVPASLSFTVLCGLGLDAAVRWTTAVLATRSLWERGSRIVCLVVLAVSLVWLAYTGVQIYQPYNAWGMSDHVRGMAMAGEWIARNLPSDVVVEQGEVGVLGWTSGRHMNDLSFLVSTPDTIQARPANVSVVSRHTLPPGLVPHPEWIQVQRFVVAPEHLGCEVWVAPSVMHQRGVSNSPP